MPPDAAMAEPLAIDPAVDPAYEELNAVLVDATGHYRLPMRRSLVLDKVRHRLARQGLSCLDDYLGLLRGGAAGVAELDCLIAELTVGETSFFRHPDHFDLLRDHVLPASLQRNAKSRSLRIWSAGCANGAEAYSIAIVVRALLGERLADWTVTIVGSDINRAFLADAERGVYSAWSLRDVPKSQIPAHFSRSGASYAIRDRYRAPVRFVYHNLIREECPSIDKNIFAFDVIFCRNVMIYFDEAANRVLAERLARVLVDGGWLFVGPSDFNPHLACALAADPRGGTTVFRKVATPQTRGAADGPAPGPADPPAPAAPADGPEGGGRHARPDMARPRPAQRPSRRAPARPDLAAIVDLANRADWGEAASACSAFLGADPCNAGAHYYHALILQSSGAAEEAELALKRAIYLDRDFALAHYQLGLARKAARDLAGCARALRNTLDALGATSDGEPVSLCGQITAGDVRDLASQQLDLLGRA